jgi:NAD(P)-dependent dehydrogenase (short-subunit alcohol dehydrogenase family)
VFVADRDEMNGRRVATAIIASEGSASFLLLDVTNDEHCRDAQAAVEETHGRLDTLARTG